MRITAPLLAAVGVLSACAATGTSSRSTIMSAASSPSSAEPSSKSKKQRVLSSFVAYQESGSGSPVVFLHGNPTSSYVWRNVMPAFSDRHRTLAPDLIGMGQSGKPDIDYRFADHARYLNAWFDALNLNDVTVVGYDWGGVLALDWAARHPGRVKGVVVFETFLRTMTWADWSGEGLALFKGLRTPGVGERMVLEQNAFLSKSLGHGVKRGLSAEEMSVYSAPFPDAASRRPMLAWPRQIPIEGEPADVVAVVEENRTFLTTENVPKLLLTFAGPGLSNAPDVVSWAKTEAKGTDVVALGPAGHHAPEDAPREIAQAIAAWMERRRLP